MKTLCENCHTFFDLPQGQEGRMGCPYCEHINRLSSKTKPEPVETGSPVPSDHNNTMIGYLDGSLKDEVTAVKRFIQNKKLGLPKEERFFLILEENTYSRKEFQITKEKMTIGRKNCDILLKDPEVSRQHCAIECYHEIAILKDLGSANGTMLNKEIVKEDFLKDQDELQVGNTVLRFSRRPID